MRPAGFVYLCLFVCLCVSMFDSSTVCEFAVSSTPSSSVRCLTYTDADDSVYVVLDGGRMVVCNGSVTSSRSPVRTECHGNGRPIHCIAARTLHTGLVILIQYTKLHVFFQVCLLLLPSLQVIILTNTSMEHSEWNSFTL